MSDPNIVQPAGSSYSLPQPTTSNIGDIPKMSLDRQLPRQISTGGLRGTQMVGGNNVLIDSSNNRISIGKLPNIQNQYAVNLTDQGLNITDGVTTFLSITKDGIIMNDGETDRVLIGVDVGGF